MAFNISALKLSAIKKGSQGPLVSAWQRFLKEADYPIGIIDGDFGNATDAATRSFQQKKGLQVTGVVDTATYGKALNLGLIFKVPNFSAGMLLNFLGFGVSETKDLQKSLNAIAKLNPAMDEDGDFGLMSINGLAEAYKQRDVRLRVDLEQQISSATKQKMKADFGPALDILTSFAKRLRFRLSGPHWYDYFQTSRSIADLASPFRQKVQAFQKALTDAGAQVIVTATYRPPERAYLMHYAASIDRGEIDPDTVPNFPGVDINWSHYYIAGSLLAASQMVDIYGIGGNPVALESLHTQRLAVDWNITWEGTLSIKDGSGDVAKIGAPQNGANNDDLFNVGASYGVYKLEIDPPHWSYNGH